MPLIVGTPQLLLRVAGRAGANARDQMHAAREGVHAIALHTGVVDADLRVCTAPWRVVRRAAAGFWASGAAKVAVLRQTASGGQKRMHERARGERAVLRRGDLPFDQARAGEGVARRTRHTTAVPRLGVRLVLDLAVAPRRTCTPNPARSAERSPQGWVVPLWAGS